VKGHGSKFGREKEVVIAALFAEKNQAEATRVAGIDHSTLKQFASAIPNAKLTRAGGD
jgi:hypothetical protein